MSKIASQLEALGLDKKESLFYMAVLQCGSAPVTIIAERAGVSRTNGYALLAKLENRGLVSQLAKDNGVMHVMAEDPEVMIRQWERNRLLLDDVVPQLKSMFNASGLKPRIHFYDGDEGMLKALAGTLACRSGVLLGIQPMHEPVEGAVRSALAEIMAERIQRGISLRVLCSPTSAIDATRFSCSDGLCEWRHASVDLGMTMYIHDDKVTYLSAKRERYGMVIESPEVAALNRAMFEGLWATSIPMQLSQ